MPRNKQPNRFAVLIDAENIPAKHAPELIEALGGAGRIGILRAYANFAEETRKAWSEQASALAIEPCQVFPVALKKNSVDIAMTIDAMDIVHAGRVDGICLASGDGDFTRLAIRIRQAGLTVTGIAAANVSQAFRAACDQFIVLSEPSRKPKAGTSGNCAVHAEGDSHMAFLDALKASFQKMSQTEKGSYSVTELGQHLRDMEVSYSAALTKLIEDTGLFAMTKNKQKFKWKESPPAALKPPALTSCRNVS